MPTAKSFLSPYYLSSQKRSQVKALLMNTRDKWVLNFPHMPETLEIARAAQYLSAKTPSTPDGGIVMYTGTDQLKIPVSFKVHAFDTEFCPNGPLTILEMAGRLHSLVTPNFTSRTQNGGNSPFATSASEINPAQAAQTESALALNVNTTENSAALAASGSEYWPISPAPVLFRVITSEGGTGVQFYGYVESAKVSLRGPWLQVQNNSSFTNLPTSAEFSFTVVHSPSYFNASYMDFPSGLIAGNFYTAINQKNQTSDSTSAFSPGVSNTTNNSPLPDGTFNSITPGLTLSPSLLNDGVKGIPAGGTISNFTSPKN